jgi:uncharacterized membrane protein YjfL (UPF0719 family)
MSLPLVLFGVAKMFFGVVVAALGLFTALRALRALLRWGNAEEELRRGNLAVAVIEASAIIAFGLLLQHAVTATFAAMDLSYRGQALAPAMLGRFALYASAHVALTLLVGVGALALGTRLFDKLTRDLDELAEIRAGNVAPALVFGAVLVMPAFVVAPGLSNALEGLLPLPTLARDELVEPS